jgi:two-component system chemotaxis response regulator CheY
MSIDVYKLKVLLIDDEPFIRATLSQILVNIGIKNVYQTDSVQAALGETLRVRPDLVFCDIHMPGEDGFVYVSEIRNDPIPGVAATPVVMLTSDSAQEAVLTAKDLKVNGYLVKPVSHNGVKKSIERALKITLA